MIVVCGESLVDLVPAPDGGAQVARPGGSPANVAVGLGRLGVPVTLITRLSGDHFGQLIRDHLVGSHVDLSLAADAPEPTTVATVSVDRAGVAGYTFAIAGHADDGWRAQALPPVPAQAVALHVSGSLALAIPAMGDAVEALLRRELDARVITIDPNPRPALSRDVPALLARLDRWLGYADIIKTSVEDLAWTFPGQRPADLARRWRARGGAIVVITRGADGVHALGPDGACDLPARPVDLVDTVGAGDAFTAGLLASLFRAGGLAREPLRRIDRTGLEQSLEYAQRVAALACGRAGANPPWLVDLT